MLGTRHEEYTHFEDNLPFRFTKGIRITPETHSHEANWHDNIEIQYCREGEGLVMLDEKTIPFCPGDIIVVNSNVLHHTNTNEVIVYDCLIIDTKFCIKMGINPLNLTFAECFKSVYLEDFFFQTDKVYNDNKDNCRTARLCSLVLNMLIHLREKHTVSENNNPIKKVSFDVIKKTIKFIRINYERKLSLDEIAQNAAMDKYSLSREFKKLTGKTIVEYINSFRCKKASEQIAEGMPVSDAARMCGFTNMSFFTRTFRKYMGCLPSAYRISTPIK